MHMMPRLGRRLWYLHKKSWLSSVELGDLKLWTIMPWGFTLERTCLIVLSFPAASKACKTIKTDSFDSA